MKIDLEDGSSVKSLCAKWKYKSSPSTVAQRSNEQGLCQQLRCRPAAINRDSLRTSNLESHHHCYILPCGGWYSPCLKIRISRTELPIHQIPFTGCFLALRFVSDKSCPNVLVRQAVSSARQFQQIIPIQSLLGFFQRYRGANESIGVAQGHLGSKSGEKDLYYL